MSGDIDFPHGNLKPIVTVGEFWPGNGRFHVGVPDGMGAYLKDDKTVRMIVQSESYGPISAYESFPWAVNDDSATFTGSHVQYLDVKRDELRNFMAHENSAESMMTGAGNMINTMYNLKGELVGPRTMDGGPTTTGAHFSNTDAAGNYVIGGGTTLATPAIADWLMQVRRVVHYYTGLSAHAIDIETMTSYAVGAFTLGGFEKIVEFNSGHSDYVTFAIGGYNGAFGSLSHATAARTALGIPRADSNPWVSPQDIVPGRFYIGRKGFNAQGIAASDFLSRNGLAYGQVYGFAVDNSDVDFAWRDAWHEVDPRINGDVMQGAFYPIEWRWDGEVKNFEHDGSWGFQDAPVGAPANTVFWTGAGPDVSAKKNEHCTPDPNGAHAFYLGSTAGYIGKYEFPTLGTLIAAVASDPVADAFPASIPGTYTAFVGTGTNSLSSQIDLGGKGLRADGNTQITHMDGGAVEKDRFEDVDGLEVFASLDGDYMLIQEDSGNTFGERMFITKLGEAGDLSFKFIAQSGGSGNTRNSNGVGVPAGTNLGGGSHEFSGTFDLSGLLKKDAYGKYMVKANAQQGVAKRAADKLVAINDKLLMVGLQAHNLIGGVISAFNNDRGGQLYIYQPAI
ncbi:hypothetical protein T492DRAFT_611328 [Pavlovales sp. CCMP2436]|nr:hypothetical protein T492DRAFT_611328 [Pavlovales sp. CCMP2436]